MELWRLSMSEFALKAVSADRRFIVYIEPEPLAFMIAAAHAAKGVETGGILIGYIDAQGQAVVREATGKPRGSRFTWRTFLRRTEGLPSLLRARWTKNEYYLGEWHSHPGGSLNPSEQDRVTMRGIACDANYHCTAPILAIVATRGNFAEVSVTVFPRLERELHLGSEN